jgi:hypothetical protein
MKENFNTTALRRTLSYVFFGDDEEKHIKYIIPLTGGWIVPTAKASETVSTWIGYQITRIVPVASTIARGDVLLKNCKVWVRLWAVGEQAEDFILSTLFWDDRIDVRLLFERHLGKLLEGGREILSLVYEQKGANDELCWITDLLFAAYFSFDRRGEPLEHITIAGYPNIRNIPEDPAEEAIPKWKNPFKALFDH